MHFTPDSYARVFREFNPCHTTDSGEFAPKGQGKCSGGGASPIDRYTAAHARMTSISRETGREVGAKVNVTTGQIELVPVSAKVPYYYAINDPEYTPRRDALLKQGLLLGEATSVYVTGTDRADLVDIHVHPQNSPFSPSDVGNLLRIDNPASVVFGADGTSWYELRKKKAGRLDEGLVDTKALDAAMDQADYQWVVDSTAAILKARGIRAEPPQPGETDEDLLTPAGLAGYVAKKYFGGDRDAAKAAALKAVPNGPYRHRALRKWIKPYEHLLEYRSSWDEKTTSSSATTAA